MGVVIIIKQVVKIGGSLFPDNAIKLANKLKNTNSLIILGGGEFANLIRKYDSYLSFSSEVTHYTAIDCMDIIAKLVNDKVDSAKLAYSLEEAQKIDSRPTYDGFAFESLAYCMIVAAIIPIIIIYPFIQKYFAAGVNLGGVKE